MFTEKATVVEFYRLYERLHFRVFKSRVLEPDLLNLVKFWLQHVAAV